MEYLEIDGYSPYEKACSFGPGRTVKVVYAETTSSQSEDSQQVARFFKAEGYRVADDGSLLHPEQPTTLQPGYFARTRTVMRDGLATEKISLANEVGALIREVAEGADRIAATSAAFGFQG